MCLSSSRRRQTETDRHRRAMEMKNTWRKGKATSSPTQLLFPFILPFYEELKVVILTCVCASIGVGMHFTN